MTADDKTVWPREAEPRGPRGECDWEEDEEEEEAVDEDENRAAWEGAEGASGSFRGDDEGAVESTLAVGWMRGEDVGCGGISAFTTLTLGGDGSRAGITMETLAESSSGSGGGGGGGRESSRDRDRIAVRSIEGTDCWWRFAVVEEAFVGDKALVSERTGGIGGAGRFGPDPADVGLKAFAGIDILEFEEVWCGCFDGESSIETSFDPKCSAEVWLF